LHRGEFRLPDYRLAVTFCDVRNGIIDGAAIPTSTNPGIYAALAGSDFLGTSLYAQPPEERGAAFTSGGAPGWRRWAARRVDECRWPSSVPMLCLLHYGFLRVAPPVDSHCAVHYTAAMMCA